MIRLAKEMTRSDERSSSKKREFGWIFAHTGISVVHVMLENADTDSDIIHATTVAIVSSLASFT